MINHLNNSFLMTSLTYFLCHYLFLKYLIFTTNISLWKFNQYYLKYDTWLLNIISFVNTWFFLTIIYNVLRQIVIKPQNVKKERVSVPFLFVVIFYVSVKPFANKTGYNISYNRYQIHSSYVIIYLIYYPPFFYYYLLQYI